MSETSAIQGRRQPPIAAKRVASSVWILRLRAQAGVADASDLTAAFDRAIDQGARDVVVELGPSVVLDASLVDVLLAMAETLLRRDALLWLAAPWTNGRGHTLKPVRGTSTGALLGVSAALDRAVSTHERTLRANSY